MPQASDELRGLMGQWFGDPIGDAGPIAFLESHGWKLRRDWQWELPVPHHTVSCYEQMCVVFLCDEWDFGSVHDDQGGYICLCGGALSEI